MLCIFGMTVGWVVFCDKVEKASLFLLYHTSNKYTLSFRWSKTTEESLFWFVPIVDGNPKKTLSPFRLVKKGFLNALHFRNDSRLGRFCEKVEKASLFLLSHTSNKYTLSFRWSKTTEESLFWLLLIVDVNPKKMNSLFRLVKKEFLNAVHFRNDSRLGSLLVKRCKSFAFAPLYHPTQTPHCHSRWSEPTEETLFWLLLIVDVNSKKMYSLFRLVKKGCLNAVHFRNDSRLGRLLGERCKSFAFAPLSHPT
ncbi:hypothetical protein ERX46_11060 [Brumimicrobium glaciale]|uniref:Uncharacterized protein n=1 Tax=Brumimicrobium glaciale TaxID=200475 RepID=A0A4Q4KJL9_9FLAO|nr:hypothetical protein [Brumimicrobium glaciale]RYM33471.1 hypothetical protein ERX46_11060 [Brumimicrobium glaciale]